MTNEELAVAIQAGQTELIPQLWRQVERFVAMKARAYHDYILFTNECSRGCEIDDLVQSGFFALAPAIRCFDPSSGYHFLTYLRYSLKDAFSAAMGLKTKKQRNSLLDKSLSLDAPIKTDKDENLLSILAADEHGYTEESAVAEIYLQQLHEALESAMESLTTRQQGIIRDRYFGDMSRETIARKSGCSVTTVGTTEKNALQKLYSERERNGLQKYLDEGTNFYKKVGVTRFASTWTSAVEHTVVKRDELAIKWLKRRSSTVGRLICR